jgi:TPR repeat protein
MIYKEGVGVAKNPVEAHKWLKMAADLGHKEAVKDLQGLPVPPPPQKKSTPKSRATPPFSPFSQ